MALSSEAASPSRERSDPFASGHLRQGSNGVALPLDELPILSWPAFRQVLVDGCTGGARLVALMPVPREGIAAQGRLLLGVLAEDRGNRLGLVGAELAAELRYPALTPDLPQAQAFERELFEDHGIVPEGHPWLKPLRRHEDLLKLIGRPAPHAAPHDFFRMEGEGVHEVAVGPVHAGVIEPGHFRFQCYGETVLSLEIQLGYQHRGVEALLLSSIPERQMVVAESIAGDTVIGHGLAHSLVREGLASVDVPLAAENLRGIALELERAANHIGDLGALCNDVGYLPGASWFGRLRGECLNLLMELTGSRFGRSLLRPGGVAFGLSPALRKDLLARLGKAELELKAVAELALDTPSVASRFERTGILSQETAEQLGLVGPVARASGCDRDVRRDHPSGIFRFAHIPTVVAQSGDVMARALVRWLESERSIRFLKEQLAELGEGPLSVSLPAHRASSLVVSLVEGWRGELVHVGVTSSDGALVAYKVVDPSFHNWFGLAMALRENEISDFPLCNKSMNLSYAGHDL
jgi:Ni,Fe-hydrogenase III large subunit